jgi:DNA-binding transcriptional MerR regulator
VGESEQRYGIEELGELGGVSRRTVRYYVQEGLLPPPLGVGRGKHYGREHLERLLQVKTLQQRGLTLDEVRREVGRGRAALAEEAGRRSAALPEVSRATATRAGVLLPVADAAWASSAPGSPARSTWTRLDLLPGIELHLSSRYRKPSATALEELAEWCRRHVSENGGSEDE